MGYYTYFSLEIDTDNDAMDKDSIINHIEYAKEINDNAAANITDLLEHGGETLKWYDYEEDMLKVSTLFPDVTFILTGEGEDREDNWVTDYCNGKITRRRVGVLTWKDIPIN